MERPSDRLPLLLSPSARESTSSRRAQKPVHGGSLNKTCSVTFEVPNVFTPVWSARSRGMSVSAYLG